jgi:cytochrome c biogenesis protein CcmG, thiol:disulfide interchange protein DsbE
MRPRRSRSAAFLMIALVAVLVPAALAGCGGSATPAGVQSGTPADVQFVPVDQFKVANYSGKPLVVNVFGTWCGPCNMEAPDLATFSHDNPGVTFVGVAVNDTEGEVKSFMAKYGLHYPVVLDDGRISNMWGIRGVPTTMFYNAGGQRVDSIVGAASLDQFKASLAKAQ